MFCTVILWPFKIILGWYFELKTTNNEQTPFLPKGKKKYLDWSNFSLKTNICKQVCSTKTSGFNASPPIPFPYAVLPKVDRVGFYGQTHNLKYWTVTSDPILIRVLVGPAQFAFCGTAYGIGGSAEPLVSMLQTVDHKCRSLINPSSEIDNISQRSESHSESRLRSRSASWLGSWFKLCAFTSIATTIPITNRICALRR